MTELEERIMGTISDRMELAPNGDVSMFLECVPGVALIHDSLLTPDRTRRIDGDHLTLTYASDVSRSSAYQL